MDVRDWKDALLRLDVNRECTAGTSDDCCWLCDCLPDWNCVLNALGLDLAEPQPGKLCLSTQVAEGTFDMGNAPFSTADFIVWLPRKHWCIEALKLGAGDLSCPTIVVPDSVAGRLPKLRSIVVSGRTNPRHWSVILGALGPVEHLEELQVSVFIDDDLALRLARLLVTSAGSMKRVDLSQGPAYSEESDMLMCGISKCRKLRELRFCASFNLTGLADFTGWLQETETLEVLCIVEDPGDPDDPAFDDSDMEIDTEENNEAVVAAVVDLLRKNTSLKELRYQCYWCSRLGNAFKALETNTVLRCLEIVGSDFDHFHIDSRMGVVLNSMLVKNEALKSLTLENCTMSEGAAMLIASGLCGNRTLEVFDVSSCDLDFWVIQVLCSTLKENTTLHSLRLGSFRASPIRRELLSDEVRANGWYKRLHMAWVEWDVPGLKVALGDLLLCPSDLQLSTRDFSTESFATLCDALSSSLHVQSLAISFIEVVPVHVTLLYLMLSRNKSLKKVFLEDGRGERSYLGAISHGLCFNESVTELTVKCDTVTALFAETFASLLRTNETLSKVVVMCDYGFDLDLVRPLSEGLLLNKVITDFSILEGKDRDCSTKWSRSALQQNRSCLHRAVRFVLRKNVGKVCAEAFEHFDKKPSLVPCIMSTSGMSRAEAESAVKGARRFILSNYLMISGVIQSRLKCYAGSGTQMDQLNSDCLLEIAKYLKVSDVIERLE